MTINGTTQPGFAGIPLIQLVGPGGGAAAGLTITGAGSSLTVIRGLVIRGFTAGTASAIRILDSSNNVIAGNFLGTDQPGMAAMANDVGVYIDGTGGIPATNNRIGGTVAADRNVISGNSDDGIRIDGVGADDNLVQGNFIGLNRLGTAALGNSGDGIAIFNGADDNTIGGTALAARNVISANGNGITINGAGTDRNHVEGNFIGTDVGGTLARGNVGRGVSFDLGSADNFVGGTAVGAGNTIANSGTQGIAVVGVGTVANRFLGNAIFANGNAALGIDLNADGVSANDLDDADVGANEGKNFPVLTAAMTNGAGSRISPAPTTASPSSARTASSSSRTRRRTRAGSAKASAIWASRT